MSKKSSTFAPAFETKHVFLAQLVEQLTLNQWVQGSSPWEDTKDTSKGCLFLCICGKYIKIFDFSCVCAKFLLLLHDKYFG